MTVQMTEEQFVRMMRYITEGYVSSGNFSRCTARFKGSREEEEVENFIKTVECYKTVKKISEEDAIQGFPVLLEDFAAAWWQGVKQEAKTLGDALKLVRQHFAPAKPDYKIYMEIFETNQQPGEASDTFICEKRSLFSQLPEPKPTEFMQIGMIFELLHIDIRKHIKREEMQNFTNLLHKAREVEIIAIERKLAHTQIKPAAETPTSKRCNISGSRGHDELTCHKNKNSAVAKSPSQDTPSNETESMLKCFGCGTTDCHRSNCPYCLKGITPSHKKLEFYSVNKKVGEATESRYKQRNDQIGREPRTSKEEDRNIAATHLNEKSVPERTLKLLARVDTLREAQEEKAKTQQSSQIHLYKIRRPVPGHQPGEIQWIQNHPQYVERIHRARLAPKREGLYVILQKYRPSNYAVGDIDGKIIVKCHTSISRKSFNADNDKPNTKRRRGRLKKQVLTRGVTNFVMV